MFCGREKQSLGHLCFCAQCVPCVLFSVMLHTGCVRHRVCVPLVEIRVAFADVQMKSVQNTPGLGRVTGFTWRISIQFLSAGEDVM